MFFFSKQSAQSRSKSNEMKSFYFSNNCFMPCGGNLRLTNESVTNLQWIQNKITLALLLCHDISPQCKTTYRRWWRHLAMTSLLLFKSFSGSGKWYNTAPSFKLTLKKCQLFKIAEPKKLWKQKTDWRQGNTYFVYKAKSMETLRLFIPPLHVV